jgi:hypothetical protein
VERGDGNREDRLGGDDGGGVDGGSMDSDGGDGISYEGDVSGRLVSSSPTLSSSTSQRRFLVRLAEARLAVAIQLQLGCRLTLLVR